MPRAAAAVPIGEPAATRRCEVARHFETVLDAAPIPILLYNNPASAGVSLSVTLVRRLAEHDRAAGIKDSSGDFAAFRQLVMAFRGDSRFRVVQGHEGMAAVSFYIGAHAAHLGLANVAPGLFIEMYRAATTGDLDSALAIQATVDSLSGLWSVAGPTDSSYLGSMKAALDMLGVCGPDLALPFTRLDDDARARVREILAEHGLLIPTPA
jgi:dihydrodipicolinate synthase/N-acetylneuraminate lyase